MQLTGTILAEQPAATARPTHLRVVPPPPPPVNLGPSAADTPDHPGWCAIHDTDLGDGTSLCIGEPVALTCGTRGAEGERVGAGLTASTGEPAHLNLTVDGAQRAALTVASAREYAALLTHLADQADTAAALR